VRSRGVKAGLGLVALLLPGGLVFLIGWVVVRALGRARTRIRQEPVSPGEPSGVWQVVASLSFRDVLAEARAAL
jgi:hypothetical protein